jgi:FkbM family methyltransferase
MHEASKMFAGIQRLKSLGFNPTAILDIGAHNGDWSRGVRKIYPDAFILMVDGLDEKKAILAEACQELGNAEYRIALLGARDSAETAFFVVHAGSIQTGSSRFRENTTHPVEERIVPQISLNALLPTTSRTRFEMIKLDIQGGELDALAGATQFLHRAEIILMEVSVLPYNAGAPLIHDVIVAMKAHGFELFDLLEELRSGSGCLLQLDALFIRPDADFRPKPPY